MPLTDPALWDIIRNYALPVRSEYDEKSEPPRICRSFSDNVRKNGDWTDDSARRLVLEYRRFLYLKALADGSLTPPEVIDKVWHLHLGMEGDFENRFCPAIGRKLTHDTGISPDRAVALYEAVHASYLREFDGLMPKDIWPDPDVMRRARFCKRVGSAGLAMFIGGLAVLFLGSLLVDLVKFLGGDSNTFRVNSTGDFIPPPEIARLAVFVLPIMFAGGLMGFVAFFFLPKTPATISRCG